MTSAGTEAISDHLFIQPTTDWHQVPPVDQSENCTNVNARLSGNVRAEPGKCRQHSDLQEAIDVIKSHGENIMTGGCMERFWDAELNRGHEVEIRWARKLIKNISVHYVDLFKVRSSVVIILTSSHTDLFL